MTAGPRIASAHHRIDLSPSYRTDEKGRSSGHGKAVMTYGGRTIGETGEPLFAAARYLLAKGLARPEDMISTYRNGVRSMSANVEWAAGRTVVETAISGPRVGPYRPFRVAGPLFDVTDPVRSNDELVPA